jgi:hypothetical protein
MRRRTIWIPAAPLAALLLGVAWLWAWQFQPSPFPPYDRLRLGMTPAEVEAAIGMLSGYYNGLGPRPPSMGPFAETVRESGVPSEQLNGRTYCDSYGRNHKVTKDAWVWAKYWIWVAYDQDGKLISYSLLEVNGRPRNSTNPWDFLRQFFGL